MPKPQSPSYSGSLFIVSAPSGAGKSSLVQALLAAVPGVRRSVSYTTRAPRVGEAQGVHYHFVDTAQFETLRAQGDFLEWAQVHGNCYGTSKAWIAEQMQANHDVLLEIDWQGAKQVVAQFPCAQGIFILPPSLAELERRLRGRGTDSEAVIARRLAAAAAEIAQAPNFPYTIINDDFNQALLELKSIVWSARCRFAQQKARHPEQFHALGLTHPGQLPL